MTVIECDGKWTGCLGAASMIGDKGYAYCAPCGVNRRESGYERVRKLRPHELAKLLRGEPLARY
jgi:hypothetical protein